MATGTAVLDLTQLTVLCLNMLIKITEYYPSRYGSVYTLFICVDVLAPRCFHPSLMLACRDTDGAVVRPMPRCKRMLSDQSCLPHVVQLLLTFEPVIVEKTAILLNIIMQVRWGVSLCGVCSNRACSDQFLCRTTLAWLVSI